MKLLIGIIKVIFHHLLLGNLLKQSNKYDEAVICYEKAILINPMHASAWYNKGIM